MTVLFADAVHSMDIAARVGAERLREIMTELVQRSTAVVRRYGGTVDKFTGDGIMAVFGAPAALEDHAFRACLAALDIQTETARLAKEVEARNAVALRLRVGLNSGQVIAGELGSGSASYTAIGEQVGMAQRMESVAPPGAVMVSGRRRDWSKTSRCWPKHAGTTGRIETFGTATARWRKHLASKDISRWPRLWNKTTYPMDGSTEMPTADHQWSKPAAMAIPAEGYFELQRGRYGPVFPRTPAC